MKGKASYQYCKGNSRSYHRQEGEAGPSPQSSWPSSGVGKRSCGFRQEGILVDGWMSGWMDTFMDRYIDGSIWYFDGWTNASRGLCLCSWAIPYFQCFSLLVWRGQRGRPPSGTLQISSLQTSGSLGKVWPWYYTENQNKQAVYLISNEKVKYNQRNESYL